MVVNALSLSHSALGGVAILGGLDRVGVPLEYCLDLLLVGAGHWKVQVAAFLKYGMGRMADEAGGEVIFGLCLPRRLNHPLAILAAGKTGSGNGWRRDRSPVW